MVSFLITLEFSLQKAFRLIFIVKGVACAGGSTQDDHWLAVGSVDSYIGYSHKCGKA